MYYNRIDLTEGIDVAKSNNSKDWMACHCWFFNDGFKFQDSVCNSFHDLMMLCLNLSEIAVTTVKNVDYHCIIYGT